MEGQQIFALSKYGEKTKTFKKSVPLSIYDDVHYIVSSMCDMVEGKENDRKERVKARSLMKKGNSRYSKANIEKARKAKLDAKLNKQLGEK